MPPNERLAITLTMVLHRIIVAVPAGVRKLLALLILLLLCLQLALYTKVDGSAGGLMMSSSLQTFKEAQRLKKTAPPPKSQQQQQRRRNHIDQLPQWIQDYFQWHRESLIKFPGDEILTNPNAPPILLRYCGICGGLHDRLGQLPWDLYLANQTKRLIFILWHRPKPLESFLIPNVLNWTLPTTKSFESNKIVRQHTRLFRDYKEENPDEEVDFWNKTLDFAIARATTGEFKDVKVLRHRFFGHLHEDVLEERLRALGETDMIHWTPSFGHLFHALFRPSPRVQQELDTIYRDLKLKPNHYSAVHCRVRHPKATPRTMNVKGADAKPADLSGLPWTGETRDFAISVATKSLKCAKRLSSNDPIYFFSDSNDLVRFMAHELPDDKFRAGNATILQQPINKAALDAVNAVTVVARSSVNHPNAHIDRQLGRPLADYLVAFVDLYMAIQAHCVTFGVGFFALFATKISGTSCKISYQKEEWGGEQKKNDMTPVCEP